MIRGIQLLILGAALCSARAGWANDPPRTPSLHWKLDDRLEIGDAVTPGLVIQGDKLVVAVDPTRRFASKQTADNLDPFFGVVGTTISLPIAIKEFYFAARGNGFLLDDGACSPGTGVASKSSAAIECVLETQKRDDQANWPRVPPGGTPPIPLSVWRCSSDNSLVNPAAPRAVHLMRPALVAGPNPYTCDATWSLTADAASAIDAVTVILTVGANRTELKAKQVNGEWSVETPLKDPGITTVEVEIRYHSGLLNVQKLAAFEVEPEDTHSQVRIQPMLMSSHMMRSVTLGVAFTPVSKSFLRAGPWSDCSDSLCVGEGINASAVIRFSGDNSSVVQVGAALSVFLTRSVVFSAGILLGSQDPMQYWNPKANFFVGFAIDPVLLTEAREIKR